MTAAYFDCRRSKRNTHNARAFEIDLFTRKVPFEFIAAAFGVMAACPQHTFQVLTKHPARMREFFAWVAAQQNGPSETCAWQASLYIGKWKASDEPAAWPLENVWLGVTVEDQQRADERIPELLRCPAEKRWLSVEPMLEAIDIAAPVAKLINAQGSLQEAWRAGAAFAGSRLDWVVCGGESAQTRANTRPFDIRWARELLAQCRAAGVPFFMKQLGTSPIWDGISLPDQWWPKSMRKEDRGEGFWRILPPPGKTSRYKFHEPQAWPEDLRVQEFPA